MIKMLGKHLETGEEERTALVTILIISPNKRKVRTFLKSGIRFLKKGSEKLGHE